MPYKHLGRTGCSVCGRPVNGPPVVGLPTPGTLPDVWDDMDLWKAGWHYRNANPLGLATDLLMCGDCHANVQDRFREDLDAAHAAGWTSTQEESDGWISYARDGTPMPNTIWRIRDPQGQTQGVVDTYPTSSDKQCVLLYRRARGGP